MIVEFGKATVETKHFDPEQITVDQLNELGVLP